MHQPQQANWQELPPDSRANKKFANAIYHFKKPCVGRDEHSSAAASLSEQSGKQLWAGSECHVSTESMLQCSRQGPGGGAWEEGCSGKSEAPRKPSLQACSKHQLRTKRALTPCPCWNLQWQPLCSSCSVKIRYSSVRSDRRSKSQPASVNTPDPTGHLLGEGLIPWADLFFSPRPLQ